MEAVVALVILALVAIGCLELTQGASTLEYSATQWNAAVTAAESRMAEVTTGAGNASESTNNLTTRVAPSANEVMRNDGTQVTRDPWRAGLDIITISVPVAGDKRFVLRRLVPSVGVRTASVVR